MHGQIKDFDSNSQQSTENMQKLGVIPLAAIEIFRQA